MKRIVGVVDTLLKWTVIIVMGVNVLNVLWQVFTRFIMNNPSSWTEELARYLLIWVSLLGASYAHRLKMHLAIETLTDKFTGKAKYYANVFIQSMVFLFAFFVMVAGGVYLVNLTFTLQQMSAALQIPLGYVYLAIPLSGMLIMFYSAVFIIEDYRVMVLEKDPLIQDDSTAQSLSMD